jgi:hypothetical protein
VGVRQPSVLRGRLLSASATAVSSSRPCRVRSVPLGKYWLDAGVDPQLDVLGHLRTLIPGQRSSELLRQRQDRGGDRVADSRGAMPGQRWPVLDARLIAVPAHARQVQEHHAPGRPLDERADRGAAKPEDQVAFPVAWHGAVLGLCGPLADHDLRPHEALAATARARPVEPGMQSAPAREFRTR